jgi:hypothetical protein
MFGTRSLRAAVYLLGAILLASCGGGGGDGGPSARTYTLITSGGGNNDVKLNPAVDHLVLDGGMWSLSDASTGALLTSGPLATAPFGILELLDETQALLLYAFELPNGVLALYDPTSLDATYPYEFTAAETLAYNTSGACPVAGTNHNLIAWPAASFDGTTADAYGTSAFIVPDPQTPLSYGQSGFGLGTDWSSASLGRAGPVAVSSCSDGIASLSDQTSVLRTASGLAWHVDSAAQPWLGLPQPAGWPNLNQVVAAGRTYAGILALPYCAGGAAGCVPTKYTLFAVATGNGTGLDLAIVTDLQAGTSASLGTVSLNYTNSDVGTAPPGLADQSLLSFGGSYGVKGPPPPDRIRAAVGTLGGRTVLAGMIQFNVDGSGTAGDSAIDWIFVALIQQ